MLSPERRCIRRVHASKPHAHVLWSAYRISCAWADLTLHATSVCPLSLRCLSVWLASWMEGARAMVTLVRGVMTDEEMGEC